MAGVVELFHPQVPSSRPSTSTPMGNALEAGNSGGEIMTKTSVVSSRIVILPLGDDPIVTPRYLPEIARRSSYCFLFYMGKCNSKDL